MNVVCDKCKGQFIAENIKLKERYLGAMITETYYNCPKCNKKYIIAIENSRARRLKRFSDLRPYKKVMDRINNK